MALRCFLLVAVLALPACVHADRGAPAQLGAPPPAAGAEALGALDWGSDPAGGRPWSVAALRAAASGNLAAEPAPALRRLLAKCRETLAEPAPPLRQIEVEGVLYNDPRFLASNAAIAPLRDLGAWALCARVAPLPARDAYRDKAAGVIAAWVAVNHATGDPINDSALLTLLLAVDLTLPLLDSDARRPVRTWVREIITKGDAFYAAITDRNDPRLVNNWQTWRLGMRALAAVVLDDRKTLLTTKALLAQHLAINIGPDGETYDLRTRDALHYHLYDLQPLVALALFAPGALSADSVAAVARALAVLRPYYTGERQHLEFAASPVPFDKLRRDAGDPEYQVAPWHRSEARLLLRQARTVFPGVRAWTGDVVDDDYHPFDKAVCALR